MPPQEEEKAEPEVDQSTLQSIAVVIEGSRSDSTFVVKSKGVLCRIQRVVITFELAGTLIARRPLTAFSF